MAENEKLPIKKVKPFLGKAESLGCYTKTQRYNFETAWAVVLQALSKEGLSEDSPVEQLRPKVDGLLRGHGRSSKISAASLKAYQARINRLLDDFLSYNEGDFMAWKERLAKSPSGNETKQRRRRRSSRQQPDQQLEKDSMDTAITHRLVVRPGASGTIELPTDITKTELDSVWTQLEAIKTLIQAQAAALQTPQNGSE